MCGIWKSARITREIAIAGPEFDSVNSQTSVLYLIDRASGERTTLVPSGKWSFGHLGWLNDNQLAVTATDYQTWGSSENAKLYTIDVASGAMTLLNGEDLSWGSSVGSDAKLYGGRGWKIVNGEIWTLLTWDNHSELTVFDRQGQRRALTTAEGSVDFFDVQNGRIVLSAMRKMRLQELYELKDGAEIQLTHVNDAVLAESYVAQPEKISFTNDGVRIDGWVLKPIDFDPAKTYPAVLDIHGGPKAAYGEVFMHEMQYWASQGYFVFFCNPRGSDGRGNAFMDLRGKYGTVDYSDIMTFTDLVLKTYPMINERRVAVTGGSYGGFMTNWIIGHTDRFAVCCQPALHFQLVFQIADNRYRLLSQHEPDGFDAMGKSGKNVGLLTVKIRGQGGDANVVHPFRSGLPLLDGGRLTNVSGAEAA